MRNAEMLEKRVFFRLPVELPVRFRVLAGGGGWREGITANLSAGGMLLRTGDVAQEERDDLLEGRCQAEICLQLPGRDEPISVRSRAMWAEDPDQHDGMMRLGFQFLDLDEEDQESIRLALQGRSSR